MPRAKAAAEHVVAKSVDSGRGIHGKIVGGRKPSSPRSRFSRRPCANYVMDEHLPAKLTHPEKFLP